MVYGGIRHVKRACMYAPLFCLYSRIITQTARSRVRRRHNKNSIPIGRMQTWSRNFFMHFC